MPYSVIKTLDQLHEFLSDARLDAGADLVTVYDVDTDTEHLITHSGIQLVEHSGKTVVTFYINGTEEFVPGSEF